MRRAILLLLLGILLELAAFGQTEKPTTAPRPVTPKAEHRITSGAPVNAAPVITAKPLPAQPNNKVLVTRDPAGRVIGTRLNPEASQPLRFNTAKSDSRSQKSGLVWQTVQVIFRLLLVLGIAYLLALFFKRAAAKGTLPGFVGMKATPTASRLLRVVETLPLGQGRALYLVAIGSRQFVITITNQQVTMLCEMTGDADITTALAQDGPQGEGMAFLTALQRLIPSQKRPESTPAAFSNEAESTPTVMAHEHGDSRKSSTERRDDSHAIPPPVA